jgi:hydrogenase maturation protease
MSSTLLLGIGNLLLQDEGVGIHMVEHVRRCYVFPEGFQALDGGTMGLELLPYLEEVHQVVIVDAIADGQPPGTLVRLEHDAIPMALQHKLSPHHVGLSDLLAVARLRGNLPATTVLIGIEPYTLEPGMELSAAMQARLPVLVQGVLDELHTLGVYLLPRP